MDDLGMINSECMIMINLVILYMIHIKKSPGFLHSNWVQHVSRSNAEDLLHLGLPGAPDLPEDGEWTTLGRWDDWWCVSCGVDGIYIYILYCRCIYLYIYICDIYDIYIDTSMIYMIYMLYIYIYLSGWWFGTWLLFFHSVGNDDPIGLI